MARSSRYLLPSSANPSGMRPSGRFNGEISQRKPTSRMSCNRTVDHASLSPTPFQVDGVRKISTGGSNTTRSSMTSTSAFCHWIRRFRLVQATFTDQRHHGTTLSNATAQASLRVPFLAHSVRPFRRPGLHLHLPIASDGGRDLCAQPNTFSACLASAFGSFYKHSWALVSLCRDWKSSATT